MPPEYPQSTPRVPPLSHGDSGSLASGVRPSPRVPPWHGDSRSEPGPRSPWQMAGHGTDSDSEATPRIPSGSVPPTLATGSLSEAARTLAVSLRCHVRDRRIGLNRDLYTGLYTGARYSFGLCGTCRCGRNRARRPPLSRWFSLHILREPLDFRVPIHLD